MFFYTKDGGYFQKWKDFPEKKSRRLTTSPLSPKPTHTTPFATTTIITQIVNHPQIIVNQKKENTKNTKIIVKNYKILINFVEKVVDKNEKFIYNICICVTNARQKNGVE